MSALSLRLFEHALDWGGQVPKGIEAESVDLIVTSPPYKAKDGYSHWLMLALGQLAKHALRPGGRVFMNFGQLREDLERPFEARDSVLKGSNYQLKTGQTIAWVKSIAIDGKQRGHYQPLSSNRTLNYAWEPVFTFFKPPEEDLDRLAVGVPFADKSNMKRGTRGKNGDLHCAGDAWFVPYSTTGKTKKKGSSKLKHAYGFPEELAERCIKVANLAPGGVVLDPFAGSGTTLVVAKRLGHNAVGIDSDPEAIKATREAWEAA